MIQWAEIGNGKGKLPVHKLFQTAQALGTVFVMERAFSGLSVASFPCAKGTGLAAAFADSAHKKTVRFGLVIWIFVCFCVLIWNAGFTGFGTGIGAGAGILSGTTGWLKEKFGGITGDLAGGFYRSAKW